MFKKSERSTPSTQSSQACARLKLSEIQKATTNFHESLVIGRGCFGEVYKGEVSNGASVDFVAIKRLNHKSKVGATESWPEAKVERQRLCTLRHHNIVSLIGYCNDVKEVSMWRPWRRGSSYEKKTILVYEYIPNGTLKDHLHGLRTPLTWLQRLSICIGAARGLKYLHTDTGVMHGDVRSSNILLTDNWVAKISDFGLSKIGPTDEPSTSLVTFAKGTFGYLDPYSLASGRLTMNSDVYSFGVVLLEVLRRKPAVDESRHDDQRSLVTWALDSIKESNLEDIIDSDMRNEIPPNCLKDYFEIIKRCLHEIPEKRPNMAEVVDSLVSVLADSQSRCLNVKELTLNDLEKATREEN